MRRFLINAILVLGLVVIILVAIVVKREMRVITEVVHVLAVVVLGLLAARITLAAVRFGWAPPAAKRNYPRAIWCRIRWHWLTRNLGLAYVDPHAKIKHRAAIGPAIGKGVRIEKPKGKVRHPRAHFRADEYGVVAKVRTLPRVGRAEFEKEAQHIADEWRCHRVQVAQLKPGRLIVRGMRTDPLAVPFGPERAPAGVYANPHPFKPYLGRDEWGTHRFANLYGLTGVTIGGLPDYGKTSLVLSWLVQLAGTRAVQFVFIDGKGGGDYDDWSDRAWLTCGHDLERAAKTWPQVEQLMTTRLANVGHVPGPRNRWHIGPTEDYPLIVTVADECHSFFDLEAARANGKQAEQWTRQCRTSAANLVRMGRSVLMLNVFITQKQTGDAIPTAIRDVCQLGFSFAVRTRDAAVAGLGEHIRDYPSYCPTQLREKPTYIGVCTASLPTGADPFVRLRVPEISEDAAAQRATETAGFRSDPTLMLPPLLHVA
jgi:S-DNA-T family DNA segregation ATPase FtsK/SpoIIIE